MNEYQAKNIVVDTVMVSTSGARFRAKEYLTGALNAGLDPEKGSGPLAHNYRIV